MEIRNGAGADTSCFRSHVHAVGREEAGESGPRVQLGAATRGQVHLSRRCGDSDGAVVKCVRMD